MPHWDHIDFQQITTIKKIAKGKKIATKRKLKLEDCKHYLEVTQLENEINQLEKDNCDVDSLRKNHKEFIRNSKLTLKSQRRYRREKNNLFTEDINKVPLSANNDKRIQ